MMSDSGLHQLDQGMALTKCRQCGCMKDTLDSLQQELSLHPDESTDNLLATIEVWQQQMQPVRYTCLGCDHCFPAEAANVLYKVFPHLDQSQSLSCTFDMAEEQWPPVPGEYVVLCEGNGCPVAVSTLGSLELVERLVLAKPEGLCIVGKTETENIGIDKIVKNINANPAIRFLLVVGQDPDGHQPGKTLVNLWKNGVDENMRVIRSPGRRPVLKNVNRDDVDAFRSQVQVRDMIGCEDIEMISAAIKQLTKELSSAPPACCSSCGSEPAGEMDKTIVPTIQAKSPDTVEMDKAGYFVILLQREQHTIIVEHYDYGNHLLRVIRGQDARSIYWTIIQNEWVSLHSHAAYLGKELQRAELAMEHGFKFVQDGA